ncbi:OmpA family protein [Serinibacter salmoneus]|uniref:Outer membrane protein OmpA-like peptidoglycan-associated protein n=1 Tax=Serinibacter salmoneus TaxID=556530 RepID=A0A2A9D4N7_9MICO|nr:OmpA family protein [Serinibacter salmoneus]PFG21296.1 outer membrane protein OmpA-like peptidoglycan-associated protein [Serinibacter salmoneus]
MNRMSWSGALAAAVFLAGCTAAGPDVGESAAPEGGGSAEAVESEAGPSAAESASTEPDLPGGVVVERLVDEVMVTAQVGPLVTDGDLALLEVAVSHDLSEQVDLGATFSNLYNAANVSPTGALVLDGGEVLHLVRDGEGVPVVAPWGLVRVPAGETTSFWSLVPAPGEDSGSVDVLVRELGLVTDVPVVRQEALVLPEEMELEGALQAEVTTMDVYAEDVQGASSTRVVESVETVSLASEVLFAPESAELNSDAQGVLERTAAQVQQAGASEVSVVGHTDDVGTDSYNDDLSLRRAQAVAQALTPLLPQVAMTVEGRGKREPVAEGTSDEARAANRRVEVSFEGEDASATSTEVEAGVPTELPEPAEGVYVGSADEGVSTEKSEDLTVTAQVMRHERFLEAQLTFTNEGTEEIVILGVLSRGAAGREERGLGLLARTADAHALTILTPQTVYYPLDYVYPFTDGEETVRLIVGERMRNEDVSPGASTVFTVLMPDPGTDTVTLEAPGSFRLLDVPVTEVVD